MKYNLLFVVSLLFSLFLHIPHTYCSQVDSINQSKVSQIISEIKKEYAPDPRLAIFDVKYSLGDSSHLILSGKTNQPKSIPVFKKILDANFLSYEDSISILPNSFLKDNIYGVVKQSVINLRTKPNHAAEMASQALLGMPVLILDESNGWFQVQTPDNYIAWTEKSSIQSYNLQEMNAWTKERKIIFWSEYGSSYEKPSIKSQRVSDLTMGNVLKYIASEGKFIKVAYPDNRIAYIEKSSCKDFNQWVNSPNPTREEIAQTALKLMGIPYLWGGTSLKGMDCSGFTKTIFFLHGIIIQRDASQQARWGGLIETENVFDNIEVGDLLFFGQKKSATQKESITHVGIYLGNRMFIDAAGNISLNSFDPDDKLFDAYRFKTFVKARNYLNNTGTDGIVRIKDSPFYNLR